MASASPDRGKVPSVKPNSKTNPEVLARIAMEAEDLRRIDPGISQRGLAHEIAVRTGLPHGTVYFAVRNKLMVALPVPAGPEAVFLPPGATGTGLLLPEAVTFEKWSTMFSGLQKLGERIGWYLGDLWLYGDKHFHKEAAQAVEESGWAVKTVQNAASVCKRFPPERRQEEIPFSHYAAMVKLSNDDVAIVSKWLLEPIREHGQPRCRPLSELRRKLGELSIAKFMSSTKKGAAHPESGYTDREDRFQHLVEKTERERAAGIGEAAGPEEPSYVRQAADWKGKGDPPSSVAYTFTVPNETKMIANIQGEDEDGRQNTGRPEPISDVPDERWGRGPSVLDHVAGPDDKGVPAGGHHLEAELAEWAAQTFRLCAWVEASGHGRFRLTREQYSAALWLISELIPYQESEAETSA